MHWKKYEDLIVHPHGVILEGWPNEVFDPNDLGLKDLQVILVALTTGKCYWRKLDDEERAQREQDHIRKTNEIGGRKRKRRSDAGKKRVKLRRIENDGPADSNPGN